MRHLRCCYSAKPCLSIPFHYSTVLLIWNLESKGRRFIRETGIPSVLSMLYYTQEDGVHRALFLSVTGEAGFKVQVDDIVPL